MADIVRDQGENIPTSMRTRYRDMEDGTHAPIVATVLVCASESSSGSQVLLTDETTGALATISVFHHQVHEGDTFQASYKTPDANPLADDATLTFVFTVGTTQSPHIIWEASSGGDFEIELYEGARFTGGAVQPVFNMKRSSTKINTMTIRRDPNILNVGVLMHNHLWPGGTGRNAPGGVSRPETEWVLDRGQTYMLRLTNRAGAAQPVALIAQWYEEAIE